MKVRWTAGSVRFRISPEELASLTAGEVVEESLAGQTGGWLARLAPGASQAGITFLGPVLTVSMAPADLAILSRDDTEGVYFRQDEGVPERYYVEKDFPCVHPRAAEAAERVTGTFPPPPGFADRKM